MKTPCVYIHGKHTRVFSIVYKTGTPYPAGSPDIALNAVTTCSIAPLRMQPK